MLSIEAGNVLFILGANGAGKSNLMHRFYTKHFGAARRISAHRQTWLASNAVSLSPEQKRQTEETILQNDRSPDSRWLDHTPAQRPGISIFDLIDSENVRARTITSVVDGGNIDLSNLLSAEGGSKDVINDLLRLSAEKAPIAVINELMQLSNLPIVISVHENEQVLARKSGSDPYSVAELSDGERNAILIAADVLTVKPNTLVLIDEPERHLHRSIISPLLTLLFAKRSDCAFVVSTHEVMLPLDNPNSQTLLLRGCTYEKKSVSAWDTDFMQTDAEIDEALKKDILGARRKMLFVEGSEGSLDKPLYSLVFPNVSVIPKAGCKEVEHAVAGIRGTDSLHWIHAFGIVDNDGRNSEEIERLKARGVYALAVYSVESVYYHPKVQQAVTERHADVTGEDAQARIAEARAAAISTIAVHKQRLSERAAERNLRELLFDRLPGKKEFAAGLPLNITLDIPGVVTAKCTALDQAIKNNDLESLIKFYPVRDTGALGVIAKKLGFTNRTQYESTVRRLLMDDDGVLMFVRSLFGSLTPDIAAD